MRKRYIILAGIALLIGYAASRPTQPVSAQFRAEIDREVAKTRAERLVRAQLKDPESAKFSGVIMRPNGLVICGYVNAKNSFGGYTGNKEFFTVGKLVLINDGSKDFQKQWNTTCAQKT